MASLQFAYAGIGSKGLAWIHSSSFACGKAKMAVRGGAR